MLFNKLSKNIYEGNKARGFWDEERNVGEMLMLVTTELAEALEAHRSKKLCTYEDKMRYIESSDPQASFKKYIKDSFEDEIADAVIRLLDMCGGLGIDIDFHIEHKLLYNASRPHKHGKEY